MTTAIIFFIAIFIVSIYTTFNSQNKPKEINDKELLLLGKYIGGCKEIYDSGLTGFMKINENVIEIKYAQNSTSCIYSIPIENVLEAYLQSEEDIQRQVTLGRLLVFGVLAFGLKKTSKNIKKYMVIKFLNKKGEEDTIIYDSNRFSEALEKINYFKDKCEENIKCLNASK